MTGLPRDEDAVRHPAACQYCGQLRLGSHVFEFVMRTRYGYDLNVCADCADKFPHASRMMEVDRAS